MSSQPFPTARSQPPSPSGSLHAYLPVHAYEIISSMPTIALKRRSLTMKYRANSVSKMPARVTSHPQCYYCGYHRHPTNDTTTIAALSRPFT